MNAILAALMAGGGIALPAALYYRLYAGNKHRRLKKHRKQDAGLSDLLIYAAMVDDGVIVGKDGSFMAAWQYRGEDNASASDEQRNLVSFRINQALSRLGSGWMMHLDAVRRPAPRYSARGRSHFTDPVTAAMDEERRQLFERMGVLYDGSFMLTLTWLPPLLMQRKFVELMFDDDATPPGHTEQTQTLIEHFKRECLAVESRLSSALTLERLRGRKVMSESGQETTHDDFLSWLQFCVTGNHHPVQLPTNPMYLDMLIGGQDMVGGVIPRIGRKFIQVVAIEGYPTESYPGILTALAELQSEYRWSTRFIFMEQHEAISHLGAYRSKWKQKIRGFFDQVFNTHNGAIDQDAVSMVSDAEAAMADVSSGLVAQGYYTSVVVLMDEDRPQLEASSRAFEKMINNLGFTARIETFNTMDAYLGSLPGHGVENVRRPLMNTMNLADLLPTSTIWNGQDKAPCPMYQPGSPALMLCITDGGSHFWLNLHVRDVGHTLITGPTGSGKSTLLAMIVAQLLRYLGITVYVFDKGMSMYPLARAAGGRHYTIAADDERLAFCPLQFLESRGDRAWAMEWIDALLALNGLATTPNQRSEISLAIANMHDNGAKTLSEFYTTIQDRQVREALKVYTV
ncbi:MAG: conjugal transfer protein TrbE, partial [Nitrosospira sp.]